jgi:hypothetical protein
MKSPIFPIVCAAGFAVLALTAGCESTPVRHPRTTQTVILSADKPAPDVEIEVVTAIRVLLPGPEPGSDHIWEIVGNNSRVLDQASELRPSPGGPPGPVPATEVTFYALRPGRSVLRFVLIRPNEAEAIPAAKCAVVIRVND